MRTFIDFYVSVITVFSIISFFEKGVISVAWGKKRLIDYATCGG